MAYSVKDLRTKQEYELSIIAEELGLQLNFESLGKNNIINEIIKAQEEIEAEATALDAALKVEPVQVEAKKPHQTKKATRKFKIIISNQDGVDQTPFVKVQTGGVMYTIPREVEVVVPEAVVEVLKNAVVHRYNDENGEWVERTGRRFPFNILGEV